MRFITLPVVACLVLSGCATSSKEVTASYISPLTYQQFTCQQIAGEAQRVSAKTAELAGVQDQKVSSDAVTTGVAVVLFWPAAFLVKGDGQTAAELGQLKGQFDALEQASIQKNCGLQFRANPKPAT